jgi:carbon-monoxide dehydrogenase small subunit
MDDGSTMVSFTINGVPAKVMAERSWTLLHVIREVLGLTGTKYGCGTNDCGACKVLIDGKPRNACVILARNVQGADIITIEGLQQDGELSILQRSFVDAGAIQCGFCTPGMIISATALLADNPDPTEAQIRAGFSNNLCRCTGYVKIVEAVQLAAGRMASVRQGAAGLNGNNAGSTPAVTTTSAKEARHG